MSIVIQDENGISYEIDPENFTAKVTKSDVEGELFIPRSIVHQSQEYVITEINKNSFQYNENIESIDFSEDSELQSIGEYAFSFSSLKSISIPSSVKELKYGWCNHTWNLATVNISPESKHFSYLDDEQKIIVAKSDYDNDDNDIIIFGSRDIESIHIPPFITFICAFAFSGCTKLQEVRFSEDSQLQSIGDFAFSFTAIKEILIPPHVKQIGESCFEECENIQQFEFSENSELRIIGKGAFSGSAIDYISIPHHVDQIGECAFAECCRLQKVEFSENSKLKRILKNTFYHSSLESILIPRHIKEICEGAFSECYSFKTIFFPKNIELEIIQNDVFTNSSIESFFIPSSVTEIKEGWCSHTMNLTKISISPKNDNFTYLDNKILIGKTNNNCDKFDKILFARRDIEVAVIPSFIKKICHSAFCECKKLRMIVFSENSELESIGNFAFADSALVKLTLPFHVKELGENAFNNCGKLKNLYFQENSELKTICEYAFSNSSIESLSIPSAVEEIKFGWCCYTYNLNSISISSSNKNFSFLDETHKIIVCKTNSEIEYFDSIFFVCRDINDLFIPSHIRYINSFSFFGCRRLKSVKFSIKNSELNSIDKYAFSDSSVIKISLPNKITKIGTGAFHRCKTLKMLKFPKESEKIGICKKAFAQSSIETVCIFSKTCMIYQSAFSYCTDLKTFEFLGENITIDIFCFNHCDNLVLMSFPNANKITVDETSFTYVSNNFVLFSLIDTLTINSSDLLDLV